MNLFFPVVIIGVLLVITLILIVLDKVMGGSSEKMITINNDTLDYEQSQPVMYTLTIQPELITISTPLSDKLDANPAPPFIQVPAPIHPFEENPFLASLQTTTTTPPLLDFVESQLDQVNINFNIA